MKKPSFKNRRVYGSAAPRTPPKSKIKQNRKPKINPEDAPIPKDAEYELTHDFIRQPDSETSTHTRFQSRTATKKDNFFVHPTVTSELYAGLRNSDIIEFNIENTMVTRVTCLKSLKSPHTLLTCFITSLIDWNYSEPFYEDKIVQPIIKNSAFIIPDARINWGFQSIIGLITPADKVEFVWVPDRFTSPISFFDEVHCDALEIIISKNAFFREKFKLKLRYTLAVQTSRAGHRAIELIEKGDEV